MATRRTGTAQPELESNTMPDNVPAVVENNLPASPSAEATLAAQMAADAGQGFENTSAADYMVPSLKLAQALSPELKKGPDFIPELDQGGIFNPVTAEVLAPPVRVVPCYYSRVAVEWKANRAGFVAEHPISFITTSKAVRNDKGEWALPGGNGNFLVETSKFYVLYEDSTGWHPAIISFKITGARTARKWMTLAAQQMIPTPAGLKERPLFSMIYAMGSVGQTKGQNSWFTWTVELEGTVTDMDLYNRAKSFREMAKSGNVKSDDDLPGGDDATEPANNQPDNDFQ